MGWRSLLAALLIGITSIAEGFALLLLVPLLQALGLDSGGGMPGRASVPISALLRLGDPPRLEAALAAFALVACVQALLFRWQSQVTYALERRGTSPAGALASIAPSSVRNGRFSRTAGPPTSPTS